jgi:carbonic anhydrase
MLRGFPAPYPLSLNRISMVYSTPISVAASDIETFKGIFPMNARPLQPLRRRMLLTD